MILHSRRAWALAMGLAMVCGITSVAQAAAYTTIGNVALPSGSPSGLVYFNGISSGQVTPPGSIDLGNFAVSGLATSTNATFSNSPFTIIAASGSSAADEISGVLNGSFGPSVSNPSLTATITSVTPYASTGLPFAVNLPLNTPMTLALPNYSTTTAYTTLTGAATVPEPTSIAVFAALVGGLGIWRYRRGF